MYAEIWPEADHLFMDDPLWTGGDGAYSVDLGHGRVLWLFGDSFVATSERHSPAESYMVRNCVALQTGYDPSRAFMRFYWRDVDGHPASWIPEEPGHWFWPGHGVRVGDRLLLFYGRLVQEGEGVFGFAGASWTAYVIDDPDAEPSEWQPREARVAPDVEDFSLGDRAIPLGDRLYVFGRGGSHHDAYLARFDLARALDGDLSEPAWWTGSGWSPVSGERQPVIEWGSPEFSVSWAEALGQWVYVETAGYGATTLAIRTAPELTGPWSEPRDVLRPPQSFLPDAFVYAGKAHPELTGADLVATYVPSSFNEQLPAWIGDPLYHPRFARITFR